MACRFVGGQVEVIRPETGETLQGVCVAKTARGYVIEVAEEQVFGTSTVVVWLKKNGYESVVRGNVKPVSGNFVSLMATGEFLKVAKGRENRCPINSISCYASVGEGQVELHLTDIGCGGFGYVAEAPELLGQDIEFTFQVYGQSVKLVGRIAHCRCLTPTMSRGGVELNLHDQEAKRQWLAVLGFCNPIAA